MRFLFVAIFLSIVSLGFSQELDFPYWLEGTWEISTKHGVSYEEWVKDDGDLLRGKTFRVFAADTIVFDTMKIKTFEDKVLFEMAANIQNTRVNAGFVLTKPTEDLWKFENPITDSPRTINYWRLSADMVYVWTETMDIEDACMDFIMTRKE